MAGSKSNYLSKKVLDHILGNSAYTAPTTVYVGLWKSLSAALTDASSGSATGEVSASGTAYGRVAISNNATNWPNASGSTTALKQNGLSIAWATATAAWTEPATPTSPAETISQFALLDASSSGNILFWGSLTTPKAIGAGDTASFSAGALTITED